MFRLETLSGIILYKTMQVPNERQEFGGHGDDDSCVIQILTC